MHVQIIASFSLQLNFKNVKSFITLDIGNKVLMEIHHYVVYTSYLIKDVSVEAVMLDIQRDRNIA